MPESREGVATGRRWLAVLDPLRNLLDGMLLVVVNTTRGKENIVAGVLQKKLIIIKFSMVLLLQILLMWLKLKLN